MNIPYSLIKKLIDLPYNAHQTGELLTMLGFELESVDGNNPNEILDIKIMANRGDALSALGLSRELLAKSQQITPSLDYKNLSTLPKILTTVHPLININIGSSFCTRYSCFILKGLKNQSSPLHVQETLEQVGIRPISLLVDLTNYILLEMGHPMHAFDFKKLKGEQINIREAKAGETLQLLNEQTVSLQPHHMVICDSDHPIALAGIMGGFTTQVDENTTEILLEAAHFVPSSIRKTRKEVGLSTEASYRFERWVDPETTLIALQRFVDLYKEWTGESPISEYTIDHYPIPLISKSVNLRFSRIQKLIGIQIPQEIVISILEKLGFQLEIQTDFIITTPPSWRQDILREEDLIEEVARVYGYEHITDQVPKTTTLQGGALGVYNQLESIYEALFRAGFNQVINHTLCGAHPLDKPLVSSILLRTPHSPTAERLRSSLLPKICETYLRSSQRSQHLFEIGKVFHQVQGEYQEHRSLAILSTGELSDSHWSQKKTQKSNFFTLKGTIEYLSHVLKIDCELYTGDNPDPRFHPTRQAEIRIQNRKIGVLGQVYPDIVISEKLPKETFCAEINIDEFLKEKTYPIQTKSVSRHPAIIRDLALIIPKSISYQSIEEVILKSNIQELEKYWVFDLYEGQGIQEDHQSLGMSFVFRHLEKNLTDQEANILRDQILKNLEPLNIFLRPE